MRSVSILFKVEDSFLKYPVHTPIMEKRPDKHGHYLHRQFEKMFSLYSKKTSFLKQDRPGEFKKWPLTGGVRLRKVVDMREIHFKSLRVKSLKV